MANLAVAFGVALILLGAVGYLVTGAQSLTALIPAAFGAVLAICGALARDPARRKMMMHIAVVVGLLGFLGSVRGLANFFRLLAGAEVQRPGAVVAQAIMAILTLIFTILCVRSFIIARRNRNMETI